MLIRAQQCRLLLEDGHTNEQCFRKEVGCMQLLLPTIRKLTLLTILPVTNLPRKRGAEAMAVKTPSRPSGATDIL